MQSYAEAVRSVRLFLEGRHKDLAHELRARMEALSAEMRYEEAAALHDLLHTVEEMGEKQKMAAVEGDDTDIFAYYAEPPLVAVNLFHLRGGHIVDRREFFWEDQTRSSIRPSFSRRCSSRCIWTSLTFRRSSTCRWSSKTASCWKNFFPNGAGARWRFTRRSAGRRSAMLELVESNAKHSFEQRFRVLKPSSKAIQEALQDALGLENAPQPHRVLRYFAHSGHRQSRQHGGVGKRADEEGGLPQIHHPDGGGQRRFRLHARSDHAALWPSQGRERAADPGLVLVDGGLGQLHAAAAALEALGITDQPLASIAKREEWIYVYGQEDEPVVLDKFSPVLHLVQKVRDEAHRFAVTFHRTRRNASRLQSELDQIPGVGEKTVIEAAAAFRQPGAGAPGFRGRTVARGRARGGATDSPGNFQPGLSKLLVLVPSCENQRYTVRALSHASQAPSVRAGEDGETIETVAKIEKNRSIFPRPHGQGLSGAMVWRIAPRHANFCNLVPVTVTSTKHQVGLLIN